MKKIYLEPEVEESFIRLENGLLQTVISGGGTNTNLTIVDETDEDDWEF